MIATIGDPRICTTAAWSSPAEDLPARPPAAGRATVLVAEDNADLRRFVTGLLEPHYDVLVAADGSAALELIRAGGTGQRRPDLVLSDVMMPGLDGFELLAAVRGDPALAAVPVILLSARAGDEAIGEGLNAGADDYVVKPFSSHDLVARVRSNLAMARLRNHEGAWRNAVLNALQDGLYVVDPSGAVVEINEGFEAVLGYGPEGLPYATPHPWWPDPGDDPVGAAVVEKAMAAGK